MAMGVRRPVTHEGGFGLVEVMLSLAVLLIVMVATSYLVDDVVKQAATNREKVAAAELAEQYLETMSNASLRTLQADISRDVLLTATPVNVGGINYSVWSHLEWATTGSSPSLCSSGNPPEIIRATITVKWGVGIGAHSLGETTIINPPYGTVVPGDGFLSVRIEGASASRPPADTTNLINVPITITPSGGSASTYNPDQNGCLYLQEPVGTYSVSLGSPSGGPTFIDWQENLAPSQSSESVSAAGLPTFVPFFYFDEAGTVSFTSAASAPLASNMPISVSNLGNLQPSGTAVVVAPGTNGTSAKLFPYTTSYSVWYGDCTTHSGVTPEEPSSPTTFTLAPQGTASASIAGLDVLQLSVTRAGGFTTAPNNVTATVTDPSAPGDGCPTSEPAYGLSAFTGSGTNYGDSTAIIPQTYKVKIPYNSTSSSVTMQVTSSGVVYNGTTYPYGTAVPVTVP
jgi:type II secretory pathway pseudopilin PulG